MNKWLFNELKTCINTMRQDKKRNWVISLSSNDRWDKVCFLDIFRIEPNNYTIRFSSPIEGRSWEHKEVPLCLVNDAVEMWFEDLENINKYKYMEY